jgi:cytochrome c peroxidase
MDWQFLTAATEAELAPILEDYNQWVVKDYDVDGNYLGGISHLLRVYLIDREQRVRNIYSVSFLHADTVANDVRTLLLEESLLEESLLEDLSERSPQGDPELEAPDPD